MQRSNQMIKYKISFWDRIKKRIKKVFLKDEEKESCNDDIIIKEDKLSKDKVMEIYKQIKAGKTSIDDLDANIVNKIMLLMNEEMKINNEKIKEKIEDMKIHLYNLEMYNKQIELLKKNP